MKSNPKSAFITVMAGLALLGLLAGCEDMDLDLTPPHVFGASNSEVPPEVLAEPRLVATPPANIAYDKTWPRLGDVPSKPNDFSSQDDIDTAMKEMTDDRTEGQQRKYNYDNPPVTDVPPDVVAPNPAPNQ